MTQENRSDELEKLAEEVFKKIQKIDIDVENGLEHSFARETLKNVIKEAFSSRDTYWKERVREIIKCKRCNGQGGYLGASLGYSECGDCGGDGHCLYNREEEKLDTLLDNLK